MTGPELSEEYLRVNRALTRLCRAGKRESREVQVLAERLDLLLGLRRAK
jgi:hypothetical protein